ncbi:MAG: hypothetical protein HKN29_08485 [Rhodothermales bacterium]|nr:hypothetical protein [Rhodothermales bacterium]
MTRTADSPHPKLSDQVLRFQAIAVLFVVAALFILIDPGGRPTDLSRLAGRLHPMLVHLPIGLVAFAVLLGLASRRWPDVLAWSEWTWLAGAWSGVAAIAGGLLLAQAGGYNDDTLFVHRLGGALLVITASWMPWLLRSSGDSRAGWVLGGGTALAAILLVITGHNGGSLTHGPDYLAAHTPLQLSILGSNEAPERLRLGDPDSTTVYEAVVAPILAARCTACHGEGRTRGGLDLRTPEGILDGGNDGPVVLAGQSESSPLIERLFLPPSDEEAMPPRDAAPLSPSGARLLSWWVDQGASFDKTLAEAVIPESVRRILEVSGLGEIRTGVWALEVEPADPALIQALADQGARVQAVALNEHFLSVRCETRAACFEDGGTKLAALADQIVWLDLSRSDVIDTDLAAISSLPRLEKLWLQNTGVSDLMPLSNLTHLKYLNVTGTQVTDEALGAVDHVDRVFSFGTSAAQSAPDQD